MLTCKECVHNQMSIGNNKEIQRNCTRNPPSMYVLPATKGIAVHVAYPVVSDTFMACGEFFDGVEGVELDP